MRLPFCFLVLVSIACTIQTPTVDAPRANSPAVAEPTSPQPGPKAPVDSDAPADVAAPGEGSMKTASGLAFRLLQAGTGGAGPQAGDRVLIHYEGWTPEGRQIDSSRKRGAPVNVRLSQIVRGMAEGLQMMTTGEKRRLWIPAELAYGNEPTEDGAPTGPLTFDVELLEIIHPPPVPNDVAAAPNDATCLPTGVCYRQIVAPVTEGTRPTENSMVQVHYSGWTTDGKLFDSSVMRREPARFGVKDVIAGWTDSLVHMQVGGTYRVWIPSDRAYGDVARSGGPPTGPLTFDIQLIEVEPGSGP